METSLSAPELLMLLEKHLSQPQSCLSPVQRLHFPPALLIPGALTASRAGRGSGGGEGPWPLAPATPSPLARQTRAGSGEQERERKLLAQKKTRLRNGKRRRGKWPPARQKPPRVPSSPWREIRDGVGHGDCCVLVTQLPCAEEPLRPGDDPVTILPLLCRGEPPPGCGQGASPGA